METIQSEKENMLWKEAKRRVEFKNHLYTYLIINSLLWTIWLIGEWREENSSFPWPLYSTLGWGIGVFFNYIGAYHSKNKLDKVEEEYQKLLRKNNA